MVGGVLWFGCDISGDRVPEIVCASVVVGGVLWFGCDISGDRVPEIVCAEVRSLGCGILQGPLDRKLYVSLRAAFLQTAEEVSRILRGDVVAARWDADSSLDGMNTGALAAHLARAVFTTEQYLRSDPPDADAPMVDTVGYFLTALDVADVAGVNAGILARAQAGAVAGPAALASELDGALHRLRPMLVDTSADRRVTVFGGMAMRLDDYLRTRIVELVVHLDDLVVALGMDEVAVPERAASSAVGTLAELARRRNSTTALVRQLARRERAPEGGVFAF